MQRCRPKPRKRSRSRSEWRKMCYMAHFKWLRVPFFWWLDSTYEFSAEQCNGKRRCTVTKFSTLPRFPLILSACRRGKGCRPRARLKCTSPSPSRSGQGLAPVLVPLRSWQCVAGSWMRLYALRDTHMCALNAGIVGLVTPVVCSRARSPKLEGWTGRQVCKPTCYCALMHVVRQDAFFNLCFTRGLGLKSEGACPSFAICRHHEVAGPREGDQKDAQEPR